ncbi:MAG: MerR family transcriptional regulator [Nocardiaceae bacterium]|nr:MerR family transcriptional regulator [Nocardiaceae bacterium]
MSELTIGELVERTGIPARTVRYYQSIGLLAKPQRVGKEAVYGKAHIDRLKLIATMQDRGMKLGAISAVLASDARARNSAADWLGLAKLRIEPGTGTQDQELDDAGLDELLGDRREEILDDLIQAGFISFRQGRWHIVDVPILRDTIALYDAGISVTISARLRDSLRQHLSALADEAVGTVVAEAGAGYAGEATLEDLLRNLERFRAIAWESAGHVMTQELIRAISDLRERWPEQ